MTNDPRGLSRVEAPSLRSDPDATRRRRDGHLLEEGTTRNTTKSTCRHEFAPKNLNVSGAFEVWIPVVAFSKACIPSKLQTWVRRPRLTGARCAAEAEKTSRCPRNARGVHTMPGKQTQNGPVLPGTPEAAATKENSPGEGTETFRLLLRSHLATSRQPAGAARRRLSAELLGGKESGLEKKIHINSSLFFQRPRSLVIPDTYVSALSLFHM